MYCMKVLQALRGRTEREIMNAPLPYVLSMVDILATGGIPYLTSTFLSTDRQRVLNLHEQTIIPVKFLLFIIRRIICPDITFQFRKSIIDDPVFESDFFQYR